MHNKRFDTPNGTIEYWTNRFDVPSETSLVFLPGLTADHRLFEKQVSYFKESYACLVWDAPSHGKSRPFQLNWTMDNLARYLETILSEEEIKRPIIIGQSLGGYIAQAYMDLFPGKTAGFVSIDSCPLRREYYSNWEIAALKHTHAIFTSIPWKLMVRWVANRCATSDYGRELMREMIDDYDKREYVDLAAHGYWALAKAVETSRPYTIHCPTLILCGTQDKAGSARRYNKEWGKRTGMSINWIEGAGHNSNTDRPDEINKLIEAFILDI